MKHFLNCQVINGLAVLFTILLTSLSVIGQERPKFIRLRNEVITTPSPDHSRSEPQTPALDEAVSGLYLLQFTDHPQAAWRDQLRRAGVRLLRFVPEDAFVVRLTGTQLPQLRALPYVRWVSEYRPDLKVYAGLRRDLQGLAPTNSVAVSVLVSPGVTLADLDRAGTSLKSFRVQSQTSLGTVLRGPVSSSQLAGLAKSDSVLWIEPAPRMKLLDEIASKIVAGGNIPDGTDVAHATATQQRGFDGRDVVIAVADSGLNNGDAATMHPDLAGRVDAFLFYGSLLDAADEHGHGTHVTGIIAGDGATGETDDAGALYGLGVAPQAHIVVQRVFDATGTDELPPYETLTHDALRAGAVIGSNSWGDDVQGRYDLSAAQFDALVRDADADTPDEQPYILEFSAGNAGPGSQTIDSPAVAKNVIATGASENNRFDFFIYADGQDAMADFSSRGPCEDGRIKPDVVAPGTWIASLQSASATDENAWAPISADYQYEGGTSQSGPHVSGAAAVFVQYYLQTHSNAMPSPALVKAALINSAVDMDNSVNTGPVPNFDEGWGRVALTNLIGSLGRVEYVDQAELLSTGQTYEHQVIVAGADQPLRITLAYTDVPGLPAALPALVNDLDLEVAGPDGQIYRGNQFIDGESVEGATASDNINNVEAVHVSRPAVGDYLVRVRARNVVEDVHHQDTGAPQQDFALVLSGDISIPGVGVVILDRSAYTAPGVIKLKLIDTDLIGQPSANVLLKSSTEINGELVVLHASGSLGIFTGAVATATGPAVSDGQLQIKDGDWIEADYQDASPAALRTATARADLVPPVISNITVTNRFGQEVVTWQTDEPATAVVFYGTNGVQTLSATNNVLETSQEVELQDLTAGAIYQFYVISVDAAGNRATNNLGGALDSFVPKPVANVLLVDAYVPDDPAFHTTDIPLSTYTDALDQSHVSYAVWDLSRADSPSPNSDDLRPFRVVIWRLSDSLLGTSTLSAPQQAALQSYVNGGGSILIASMELLSRLGPASVFRTNLLQVRAFAADVGVPETYGEDNDPVSNGMDLVLDYSAYDNDIIDSYGQSPDDAATMTINTNAAPIFLDSSSNHVAGLRFPRVAPDTAGRVVFLAFPFDAVPASGDPPNNRAVLMRNILSFLAPGLGGLGTLSLDRTAYTLPDLITIEVADSDLAGQGSATVNCFSDSMTNGIPVTLAETARRGLFRGSVTVEPVAAIASLGQLRARAGDAIWVEYYDASSSAVVSGHAVIDVEPPKISDLTVEPEYEDATVQWTTSEPADALVQFGESTFLGRTAYNEELAFSHQLTLSSLQPDRAYYYQIVSRDRADNTAVDNNNGKLYTFRTLKPFLPPWSDNLDSADTNANWSVVNGPDSTTTWTLGVPNNGLQTAAHSPPNAWGSNLEGASIETADTMLVGPALQLTGGNAATLHFWQTYDFTPRSDSDISESGQVYVSTNNTADWTLLREYTNATPAWAEEVIDLTPFVGGIVRLGWSYELLAVDPNPRPGWLIDDISVTVTNQVVGTLQISNNLAQAAFTVSGPLSRTGQGWLTTLTNAPSGEYTVTFKDVPFYQTPPPQTVLLSNSTLVVQGTYTFTDSNQNGISDAWEQQFFGTVSPSHPPTTDTDGDGMSDYAEFIAGTDPTDPNSKLQLFTPVTLRSGTCRLNWSAVAGRPYRLLASQDAVSWTPLSAWLRASSNQLYYTIPLSSLAIPLFFRVEVSP